MINNRRSQSSHRVDQYNLSRWRIQIAHRPDAWHERGPKALAAQAYRWPPHRMPQQPRQKTQRGQAGHVAAGSQPNRLASMAPNHIAPKLTDQGLCLPPDSTRCSGFQSWPCRTCAVVAAKTATTPLDDTASDGANQVWCWKPHQVGPPRSRKAGTYGYMVKSIYCRKLVEG
jgi:hypothetical protein